MSDVFLLNLIKKLNKDMEEDRKEVDRINAEINRLI